MSIQHMLRWNGCTVVGGACMGSPGAGNKLSLSNVSRALGATLALSVVSIILGIALLCVVLFFASGPQPPTDRRLLDHYTLHKTEFSQLAEMFTVEEELLLVYPDDRQCETVGRQHVEAGYSERCDEYLRLFRSLELGWAYIDSEPVYLSAYKWGLTGGHGLRKGFVYTTDPSHLRGEIAESTETRGSPLPRHRQIDENWYIYLDD